MSKRSPLKIHENGEKKEQAVGESNKEIADRLAPVLYAQIVDFCVSRQQIPELGMLVVEIQYVEGIERVPLRSTLHLYDSLPQLNPLAGNKEFANAVYEGQVTEQEGVRYKFRINPGSRMLSMLTKSTRRTYDAEKTELILANDEPKKREEPCAPPQKRASGHVKLKHLTLDEELSGRSNLELET